MKKLIFIATEDWFFASHFLPMLRAAREAGFAPAVICRVREHRAAIEAEGARVIPFEADRGRREIGQALATISGLARILRAEKPEIVHLIALWPIVLGGLAARLAGIRRRIHAVTGLGFLGASNSPAARASRLGMRLLLRGPLDGRDVRFLLENPDDARLLGFASGSGSVWSSSEAPASTRTSMRRAPCPRCHLSRSPSSRACSGRRASMSRSRRRGARVREGAPVELDLYGEPDPTNPKAISRR